MSDILHLSVQLECLLSSMHIEQLTAGPLRSLTGASGGRQHKDRSAQMSEEEERLTKDNQSFALQVCDLKLLLIPYHHSE